MTGIKGKSVFVCLFVCFVIQFYVPFKIISAHMRRDNQLVGENRRTPRNVGENGRTPRKTTRHTRNQNFGLSHMWPEQGSNPHQTQR